MTSTTKYHFRNVAGLALMLACSLHAHGWQLEAGDVRLNNTFDNPTATRVNFAQVFDTVPVVVALTDRRGGDPSTLRVHNVSTTGFDLLQVEPQANDGPHLDMLVSYVVVQPGNHVFPDGTRVSAGRISTTAVQHGAGVTGVESWDQAIFDERFDAPPVVVAALQTMANESANPPSNSSIPWLTVAARSATTVGVDLALERSESGAGSATLAETIGWIAMDADVQGSFVDNGGATVSYETLKTNTRFRGWTDACNTVDFVNTYGAAPRVVATKSTRIEDDGGWLRQCSLNANRIGLRVDEDRDNDGERTHIAEAADLVVFASDFAARFDPNLAMTKTASVQSDPVNATNPKAIPGALVSYRVEVRNTGIGTPDSDTVDFIDALPTNTALVLDDIDGPGSGPVRFTDGAASSGLTFNYASLASTLDDLSFSNDGGATFGYLPVAGPDGTDPAITHLRVTPRGRFGSAQGTAPSFDLEFRVRVE